eukprot:6355483-Alexandrium_andersonii.AAC.1
MVFGVGALQVGASAARRVTAHFHRRTCLCAPRPGGARRTFGELGARRAFRALGSHRGSRMKRNHASKRHTTAILGKLRRGSGGRARSASGNTTRPGTPSRASPRPLGRNT